MLLSIFFLGLDAQEDIPGSQDHPLLTRFPGSYIASYEVNKFQEYTISTGPVTGYRYIKDQQKVEGKVSRITYLIDQSVDQLSLGEVYQNYKEALAKAKIEVLGSGLHSQRNVKKDIGGGGWIGVALIPNALKGKSKGTYLHVGTSTSGGTFSIISQIKKSGQEIYLCIYGERHSKDLVVCHVDIIEVKAAELGLVEANAEYIADELSANGSVSIYGVRFDFNSSTIKEESSTVIAEIAKYLKANPTIALYVVGHTDMKGSYEYNLKLSDDRAKALVNTLVNDHQIEENRLIAYGVAFLAPVASNESEDGRTLNRRTELVKRFEDQK